MIENNMKNNYHLVLTNGNDVVAERIFPGDVYSPAVRFNLDVRDILPDFLRRLKASLSNRNPTTSGFGYNFTKEYKNYQYLKESDGTPKLQKSKNHEDIFTLTIYMYYNNTGVVVAKDFYVNKFNPLTRFSLELTDTIDEIVDEIQTLQREADINRIYEDKDLFEKGGLSFSEIFSLEPNRRKVLVEQMYNR